MAVDMGEAHIGVTFAIVIFDEFFKELMAVGVIPSELTFDRDTAAGPATITILLDPPDFVLAAPGGTPRTELSLTGVIEARPIGQPDVDPILTLPLAAAVVLSVILKDVPDDAPVLGLRYDGVAAQPSAPITEADIDDLFARPQIADTLAAVEIDAVGEAIVGLEPILFGDAPPPRDTWATAVKLLPAAGGATMDALGVFVAAPGVSAVPTMDESPLPALTGVGLIYSRALLDVAFAQGAAGQIGQTIEGAEIKELTLVMDDEAIHIEGRAEKDIATITFEGPVVPRLIPGTIAMFQDTSAVDVDVDVPWWADVLLFFRFIPVFWPILIPVALIKDEWDVWAAANDIAGAPVQVRSGLAGSLANQLIALASGLAIDAEVESIELASTPDSSRIENGHMLLFGQAFVSTLTETISDAFYSGRLERFVQYVLESGRLFRASELARLVEAGKIVTPGFHDVAGSYMRANPDNTRGNNLEEMFGNNPAREPY
jgi:hypothetical protein